MKLNSMTAPSTGFRLRTILPRRTATRSVLGAGLALGLLVVGALSVGASPWGNYGSGGGSPFVPPFSPSPAPTVAGTVATAPTSSTGSFMITAWGGVPWTVDLSGSTAYTEPGVSSPTFSNVAVGDEVSVNGASTGSNTVDAISVSIIQKPVVVGTVATAPASSAGSFTLTACKGSTWTVDLTGSTTYTERGVTSPGFSDIAVGDEAVVFGSSTGTDTATATSVVIIQKPVVSGTVATAPGSSTGSFTVTAWKGVTWTVDLTGSTTYTERGVTSPGYSDVAVGDEVVVYGTSTGTDTVSAGSVVIMQRPAVVGTVATAPASSTGSFTVTAWKQQTVTVDLTGSTSYTERGVTSPGYSDVAVGDEVVVYGTSTGTDTFTASSVVIIQRPAVTGKVATAPSSSSGSFTVTAWQNQTWIVDLSGSTTYLEWGVSSPSYSDVAVGDEVVVYGTSTGTDTVAASSVVIMSHSAKAPPSPWAVGHVSPSPTPALTGLRVGIGGATPPDGWSTPHGGGSAAGGSNHQGSQGGGLGSLSGGAQGGRSGTPGR